MTFPIDLHIGSIVVPLHFLFELAAVYIGFRYYWYLSSKRSDPLSQNHRAFVIGGGLVGALVGSRLVAALEHPDLFFNPPSWLFYYQNQSILGAIVGALIGVEIIKLIIGEKKRSGDVFTYPLILGIMIGRIGCFLTGVKDGTVGVASNVPWAFDQGDGIARHPTALYEIVFLGIMWILLRRIDQQGRLENGMLFRLFLISYAGFRFLVEFIKPIQPIALGLSAIQIACACIVLWFGISLAIHFAQNRSGRVKLY